MMELQGKVAFRTNRTPYGKKGSDVLKSRVIFYGLLAIGLSVPLSARAYAGPDSGVAGRDGKNSMQSLTSPDYKPGLIRHIVLFRYRDGTTSAQIAEVRKRFLLLAKQARRNGQPYIHSIEAGAQMSEEGVSRGFQEGFIVTFCSRGDRNFYVGSPLVTDSRYYDPAHHRFKEFVGPLLAKKDGVLVFDFRTGARGTSCLPKRSRL